MKQYEKIENIFKRSTDGSKKVLEGEYRLELIAYLKDSLWEFSEKIDGMNIRVMWDGHKVSFAGRTDRALLPHNLVERLQELFSGEENETIFEQLFGAQETILFGEGFGGKIQNGHGYSNKEDFVLFDVCIEDTYLSRDEVRDIAMAFGIDDVPVCHIGTLKEGVELVKTKITSAYGDQVIEGFVARPLIELQDKYGNRAIVKIKVSDFEH